MVLLNDYLRIREEIPSRVTLVAVSKFKPAEDIIFLKERGGQLDFGENRAQECAVKAQNIPGIRWHFIGHLQTNKVKMILPYTHLIHSVDSSRLLAEIQKESAKLGKVTRVLLQFHIASEETKFGFSIDEAMSMLESGEYRNWDHISICGVMGMATFTENVKKVREEFRLLRGYFEQLQKDYFKDDDNFREISMGMSGDYRIAIEEGSTLIRIGSLIFGERQ